MAMLREAFYWVCNMSILSTLSGCLVLALRRFRRIPQAGDLWAVGRALSAPVDSGGAGESLESDESAAFGGGAPGGMER